MCGIVAYIGKKEAYPILIKGLQRLEYRGYDSAGIALMNNKLNVYKKSGKVQDLKNYVKDKDIKGTIGIGHTRWATHGEPNDINAHPHTSESGDIVLIHNGIIENYGTLKEALKKQGHHFKTQTDTEVLAHFIEHVQNKENVDLEEAVRIALNEIIGAYAIVILSKKEPEKLIAARKASPLVIGIGDGEYFLASDATPIVEHTKNVIYLNDEEVAVVNRAGELSLKTIKNKIKTPYIQELELKIEMLEKSGFDHFMLKEIFEQPDSIKDSMRGRISSKKGFAGLGGLREYQKKLLNADRMIMAACGTSWHACLVGEYVLESLARIPVEVEYASEFRYRNPIINENDVLLAVSQSGETADTLAAIELAKDKGATVLGICNVVGSSISRATHAGSYTHAGPEIGVASTKAFTAQLTIMYIMSLSLAYSKGRISESRYYHLLHELEQIPKKVKEVLDHDDLIKDIAERYKDATNFLYLGRGNNFPVALEGALKLKEISYIHAEGYPAAEMKHGPIALIDEEMPVVILANNKDAYEKIVSNIQEVKSRKGKVIAIVAEDDKEIREMADHTIDVPHTEDIFAPMLSVIPLQLLAYHIAVMRGCNVDQPRNLAKSVTVE